MVEGFDIHWLVQLTLASALLVLFVVRAFPDNAASRRSLALSVLLLLTTLPPLLFLVNDFFWYFEVQNPWPLMPLWKSYIPLVVLCAWFSGSLALLLRVAWGVNRRLKGLRRMPLILGSSHARCIQCLHGIADRMGYHEQVALRLGGEQEPCSTSLGTPTVMLPQNYSNWREHTLEAVLAHELVHLARRDSWTLLLMHLVRAFYWWMPWMGSLSRALTRSIEESCDDRAAEILGSDTDYLSGLADVARRGLSPQSPGFEPMVSVHLSLRFHRFLWRRKHRLESDRVYWGLVGILGLVLLATGVYPIPLQGNGHGGGQEQVPGMLQVRSVASKAALHTESPARKREYPSRPGGVHLALNPDSGLTPGRVSAVFPRVSAEPDGALQAPSPIYPGHALMKEIEGSVLVEFRVTGDGHVTRINILKSEPVGVFDGSVLSALARYRYPSQSARGSPAFLRARVSRETVRKRFRFSIQQSI